MSLANIKLVYHTTVRDKNLGDCDERIPSGTNKQTMKLTKEVSEVDCRAETIDQSVWVTQTIYCTTILEDSFA